MQIVHLQSVHKGPRMCILGWDLTLYENYHFKNYWKLPMAPYYTKTGTRECYIEIPVLGVGITV